MHRHGYRRRLWLWRFVIVRGQAEVFFRKSSQPLRFCDAAISPMMVGELGVLVEEEEMRVEELIVSTKEPHEQLYRPDVDEQAQVSQPS